MFAFIMVYYNLLYNSTMSKKVYILIQKTVLLKKIAESKAIL